MIFIYKLFNILIKEKISIEVYKMIIFDLDDTLVNTSKIKQYRRRDWTTCCNLIATETELNIRLDVINKLKEKFSIGIVTNSPRFYAEKVLDNFGIKVDVLITYRDTKNHKPHPEPMLLATSKLNLNPEDCIAIGDDVNDILSSNRAGMRSIGVTWGESLYDDFNTIKTEWIFNEKEELEKYLLSLLEK